MTTVPGASQYLNAFKAGNKSAAPSLLGGSSSVLGGADTLSLLDAGRGVSGGGFGLSSSARAINSSLAAASQAGGNKLLSLAAGTDSTIEGAKTAINALRSTLPQSSISESLRGVQIDEQA